MRLHNLRWGGIVMQEKISEGKLKAERKALSGEGPVSDLKEIPGIGAKMAQHMHNIGIQCIADLKGRDPEELYHLDCLKKDFRRIGARYMCTAARCISRSMRSGSRKN